MLEINNLHVSYGQQQVLNKLELKVAPNTIHGLVGLNGAGKTTLLNSIFGIKKVAKGTITLFEETVRREQIGYLETNNYFYPKITGKEYLNIFKTQNPSFSISNWNELFELPLNKLIDSYSTGMKKKLALMAILCLNRDILILDEPFNGLDLETVQKLKALLLELKAQKLILITSHILESLTTICDSISYLKEGIIELTYPKEQFNDIENHIFSKHQEGIDNKVQDLLRSL